MGIERKRRTDSDQVDVDVVVVGGGPAGLAVSACLDRAGLSHVVLEREDSIAPAWRRHYDRLHLHTSRAFSALPYREMPRDYPRYASRDQVVAYLERYVHEQNLTPRLSAEVTSVRREGHLWVVHSGAGTHRCSTVVIATGANGLPNIPSWPGLDGFPGEVLHSSRYRSGRRFTGKDVLVIGFGNSGGEIALDLTEYGARPVVSVRGPVNVVPRDVLGIPVLAITIPLSMLPPRLADALVWPILKCYYPSYRRLGLRKAALGPFRQIAESDRIPLLDIGTVRAIRRGRVEMEADVSDLQGDEVRFVGGAIRRFDAIVLATGYRPNVPFGLTPPGRRSLRGPDVGIYFCGFYVSPTGMLREIAKEAKAITNEIVTELAEVGSS